MKDPKIIAVVGATGAQGGGLVRAITGDQSGEFVARAITRDVRSAKARELQDRGVQVAEGTIDDERSIEEAFEGAYAAYCVTFFWDHLSPEREVQQAKNMARAAKRAGLRHVIWSTLEDTRKWIPLSDERMPTINGKYKVPHYDGKGESDESFRELGLPVTFLLTSFYWENFIYFGMGPKRDRSGRLALTLPMEDKKLPGIAAEDIGRCAHGIFKNGERLIGQTVAIAGEHLTGAQMANAMSKALGQEIRYNPVSPATYRGLGFPGAEDLGNMFQFNSEFEEYYCGVRNIEFARSLNPSLQSFRTWLKSNAAKIPIERERPAGKAAYEEQGRR